MIIKTLAQLATPDEASLLIRPLGIAAENLAESVGEYRQRLVASFDLVDGVPESTRNSYDRLRAIYSYGIFSYDLYTVAGDHARLVIEQALRDRFLPFYGGQVTFVDGAGDEHVVTAERYDELYDPERPLIKRNWRLKLRSGRPPIEFNGMLAALLRWAREEGLLGGQRDRSKDRHRVWFRNYTAHPHYHRETPDDASAEIIHLADIINQLWGAPLDAMVQREPIAIAWTDTAIMYGLAETFRLHDRLPADTPCAVVLADPRDRTIGDSFDTQYEMTARPLELLWGPGAWTDGAAWVQQHHPSGDAVRTVDRLFLLRYEDRRLYMPRDIGMTAGLDGGERPGTWYLVRADYPFDALGHQRQVLSGTPGHATTGFCRECPAESIAMGTWQQVLDHCAALGADVTPRSVPDIRTPLCRKPRWYELATDGQWLFEII